MIIYKATNTVNGKVYIGKTINKMRDRQKCHKSMSLNGSQNYFHRAIRKHGWDSFTWQVIDTAETEEELNEKEKHWIAYYNSFGTGGYNMTIGGDGQSGRGYMQLGDLNHQTRLSVEEVKIIKLLDRDTSLSKRQIADMFGISHRYVSQLTNKAQKSWLSVVITDEDSLPEEYSSLLESHPRNYEMYPQAKADEDFSRRVSIGKRGMFLTDDLLVAETLAIKELAETYPIKQLGLYFNMASSMVSRIHHGKRRFHITTDVATDKQLQMAQDMVNDFKSKQKPVHERLIRFTDEQVKHIKVLLEETELYQKHIAKLFESTQSQISAISRGENFSYISIDDITKDEREEILQYYRKKADKLNIDNKRNKRYLTDELVMEIRHLANTGMSVMSIAKKVNMSRKTVNRALTGKDLPKHITV